MSCAGISKNSHSFFSPRSAVAALLFSVPGVAFGQGYSTDIELVRPVFSHKGLPGIDTPVMAAQPTLRTGFMTQYQRDPLILYQFGEELGGENNGAVVKHRSTMVLGISYDFTPSVSTRLIIPTAIHSGSDIPELEADGFGLEDIGVGVRFRAFQVGGFSLGARADFTMPTGAKESFHGEDGLRTGAGALAMFETGPFQALFDANVMTRSKVELAEDWTHGTELAMNAGVKYWVMPDRVAIWAAEYSRGGFNNFYKKKSAENTVEVLGGVEYQPINYLRFHLGGGAGLGDGYGGTAQRIVLSAKFVPIPPPRPDFVVEAEEEISSGPPPEVAIDEILSVEKKWKEGELARVEEEAIVIRDPIQFEFNTANILRPSIPTLRFVAKLMNQNARIGHVVVEGHASEEGTYTYNYDLSIRRARAIWEEIITSGVHPARLSYRGMGEVAPRKLGTEEAALAKNRRVDFHIIHRFSELDVLPEYPEDIKLPWSGAPAKVKKPEDIQLEMQKQEIHRRQQQDLEGLQREGTPAEDEPTVVPVPNIDDEEEDEPVRIEESDDSEAPEDPVDESIEETAEKTTPATETEGTVEEAPAEPAPAEPAPPAEPEAPAETEAPAEAEAPADAGATEDTP